MNPTCPTCGKTVDPLRARSVGVRDGKVVAYCSAPCAAAAETKPTQLPAALHARTPATGIPSGKSPSLESGPVIEIVRDPGSAPTATSGAAPVAKPGARPTEKPRAKVSPDVRAKEAGAPGRADTTLDTWTVADDAAAEPDRRGEAPGTSAPRRKLPLIIGATVAIVVGGLVVPRLMHREPAAPAPVKRDVVAAPPVPPPEPAKPDRNAAVATARAVLVTNMASESPRVQRVAAAALARTKDPAALELLARELAEEKLDVGKLDLGYWLARGGDERGRAALVAGLGSGRRDVKLQAGRLLAQLGDPRAASTLAAYLEVQQTRLGTAEYLAALKDERAIKALDAVRADTRTSVDDRARATIALGIAGRSDVIPDLQVLLQNANFKKFAASALAVLGEPTARAVLAEELAFPSLRVEAARSLRVLEPSLDPAPFLPELLAALASDKDTDQVQVAEAILLLAGDAAWSERW